MSSIKLQASDCWSDQDKAMVNENYHTETGPAKSLKYQIQQEENPSLQLPVSDLEESLPQRSLKPMVRAEYRMSFDCPLISLQYRTLNSIKPQKYHQQQKQAARRGQLSGNQTKNIAKNYGKAIIAFILANKKMFRTICKQTSTPHLRITEELAKIKSMLTTVAGFRKIWSRYKYAKCMRVVSNIFLRTKAFDYIFNSKVTNYQTHIKYRHKFLRALTDPTKFDHIKDY